MQRFRRLVVLVPAFVLAPSAVAQQHDHSATALTEAATGPKAAASEYRAVVAKDMREAAARVGITVKDEKLMLATRDDAFVAIAPADGQDGVFLFMQAALAGACATLLPDGYYRVKSIPGKKGSAARAEFINSDGRVVTTGALTSEERRALPEEKGKLQVGLQLRHTGGSVARTTVGTCRCEWAPSPSNPYRWRRLHVVIT